MNSNKIVKPLDNDVRNEVNVSVDSFVWTIIRESVDNSIRLSVWESLYNNPVFVFVSAKLQTYEF